MYICEELQQVTIQVQIHTCGLYDDFCRVKLSVPTPCYAPSHNSGGSWQDTEHMNQYMAAMRSAPHSHQMRH